MRALVSVAVGVPVLATVVGQSLVTMSGLSVPVLAPRAAETIGIDPGNVGAYTAIVYAAATITSPIAGGLLARYGGLRIQQVALAMASLGLVLFAVGHPLAAIVSALAIGCGVGPATPASSHILARQTPPPLQPMAFSIKQTGVPIGGALAGLLAPPLVLLLDWQGAALALASAGIVCALALQPLRGWLDADRRPDGPRARIRIRGPLALIFSHAGLRRLALASFVFSAMQLSVSAFLVVFFVEAIGLDLTRAGIAYAIAQAGGVVGRIIWGALAETVLRTRTLVILVGVATALSMAVLVQADASWPFWLLAGIAALLGATAIGWTGLYLAEVARLAPPGRAGEATGGAMFMTFGGVVFGPPLVTAILAATGSYPAAFLTLAALNLAAAAWLAAGRNDKKPE
ncbi:MFS transporter [Stella sp.]|uniref:MFS transporter n=1 Tax=Stella sp. TaxID=2912054 RepID=UPI0035AFD65D